nr:unnamed protein product [Naegleria fowleri]
MPEVQHSYHPPEEYCSFEIVVLFNAYPLEESLNIEKKKAPQGTDVIEQEEIADPQLSGEVLPTKQRNESLCSLPFSSNDTFFPIMSSSPEELTNYCSPPEEVAAIKRYDELLEENQELRKENKMMVQMILQRNKELQKEKDALMGELCDSRIQIAHLEMQLDMMQAQRDNMKDQRDSLMDMLKNQ